MSAREKLSEEKQKLSQEHLVTSSKEVEEEILAIDKEEISDAKKVQLNAASQIFPHQFLFFPQ